MRAFTTMIYRQLKRFWRARSRVIGMVVNPLIWLIFFGLGWSRLFDLPMAKKIFMGFDYLSFFAPGVYCMTIFVTGFTSGISVIWDKQFGFLKETMVAPSARKLIMSGRIVGDSIISLLQGSIILALTFPLAGGMSLYGVPQALLLGFLLSISIASLGVCISIKMTSMEGFQLIISMLMLPLVFLSGAIYPIDAMPEWMKTIAYLNPLTYAVDGSRYFLLGVSKFPISTDILALLTLMLVFLSLALYLFERVTIE